MAEWRAVVPKTRSKWRKLSAISVLHFDILWKPNADDLKHVLYSLFLLFFVTFFIHIWLCTHIFYYNRYIVVETLNFWIQFFIKGTKNTDRYMNLTLKELSTVVLVSTQGFLWVDVWQTRELIISVSLELQPVIIFHYWLISQLFFICWAYKCPIIVKNTPHWYFLIKSEYPKLLSL